MHVVSSNRCSLRTIIWSCGIGLHLAGDRLERITVITWLLTQVLMPEHYVIGAIVEWAPFRSHQEQCQAVQNVSNAYFKTAEWDVQVTHLFLFQSIVCFETLPTTYHIDHETSS